MPVDKKFGMASSGVAVPGDTVVDTHAAAARRKLIVHFFRLGTIPRYKVVLEAGVWEDADDELEGQARWARVFERAEKAGKLRALWDAVAAEDETLAGQPNPFTGSWARRVQS